MTSKINDPSEPLSEIQQQIRQHAGRLFTVVPFATALGLELVGIEGNRARAKVGWREDLVGDPDTGVIHGGVLTTLLDNLCGMAVLLALKEFRSTATLDLRIDYMRPAETGRDVFAEAECYRVTRHIAFVRATAFHEGDPRQIANATATFALNDPSRWASAVRKVARNKDPLKDPKSDDGAPS